MKKCCAATGTADDKSLRKPCNTRRCSISIALLPLVYPGIIHFFVLHKRSFICRCFTMEEQLFHFLSKYITLTAEEKAELLGLNIFHNFKKGTVLLKEGEVSDRYYFVIKGCIRTYYVVDGEERTSAFYMESESLAPACTLHGQPSEYYVACCEDSVILLADTEMERQGFEKFPRFETVCRLLSEELLAKNQEAFYDFRNSSPEERYRKLLAERPQLIQRVPLQQLASYLGIRPESLSRIRKRIHRSS